MTLWFTSKFGVKPMHFFGLWGSVMFLLGFIAAGVVGFTKLWRMAHGLSYSLVADSPYFFLSLTMMILGSQFFLAGFVGELVARNSQGRNDYEIAATI